MTLYEILFYIFMLKILCKMNLIDKIKNNYLDTERCFSKYQKFSKKALEILLIRFFLKFI